MKEEKITNGFKIAGVIARKVWRTPRLSDAQILTSYSGEEAGNTVVVEEMTNPRHLSIEFDTFYQYNKEERKAGILRQITENNPRNFKY